MEKIYIRDAIYDEIPVYRIPEEKIINRWEFQRLRYIKQLQLTFLVYPSATHTRFEHSLGVMHIAGNFIDFLFENHGDLESFKKIAGLDLVSDQAFIKMNRIVARIAGLLHDIGHGPLGHLFDEQVIPMVMGEDSKILHEKCFSHELIGFLIYWYRLREEIKRSFSIMGFDKYVDEMIKWLDQIMVPLCSDRSGNLIYNRLFNIPGEGYGYFLRMIVRDYLYPADLLDYLVRDSIYTGAVELGMINRNRLMRNTIPLLKKRLIDTLREEEARSVVERIAGIRTPIILAVSDKVIPDILRFLHARRLMYENVYLHSVIKAFGWSAVKILSSNTLWDEIGLSKDLILGVVGNPRDEDRVGEFLEKYLGLTDYTLFKAWEMYRKGSLSSTSIAHHVESIFKYRKPLYELLARDIVFATPVFSLDSNVDEQLRNYEDRLKQLIIQKTTQVNVDVKVNIEQVQIYPGSAWAIQGSHIYIIENGVCTPKDIGDFSRKYGLLNIGEVRLYVKRELSSDLKKKLKEVFMREVKNNASVREDLRRIISLTTASSITM